MRIFREGNMIHFQLIVVRRGRRQFLADFKIPVNEYEELRQHMISNLEASPLDKLKE